MEYEQDPNWQLTGQIRRQLWDGSSPRTYTAADRKRIMDLTTELLYVIELVHERPAGDGCDDAAGSEVAQVRRPPEG